MMLVSVYQRASLMLARVPALLLALFLTTASSGLVAEEKQQTKRERDLAQCIQICAEDSICITNCNNALGEGAEEGEEECE